MKKPFAALIDQEVKNQLSGKPAYIRIKINHITDPIMVNKIYDAARAGVKVDLLVRGNCSLTDNDETLPNLTDKGIIDRYLEHARIFCFCNGGDEKVLMDSADWMPRNLDCRIEVVTPVYDTEIKAECHRVVDWGCATISKPGWLPASQIPTTRQNPSAHKRLSVNTITTNNTMAMSKNSKKTATLSF